eukprot:9490886-Pyramimonas_sp.AAC.1
MSGHGCLFNFLCSHLVLVGHKPLAALAPEALRGEARTRDARHQQRPSRDPGPRMVHPTEEPAPARSLLLEAAGVLLLRLVVLRLRRRGSRGGHVKKIRCGGGSSVGWNIRGLGSGGSVGASAAGSPGEEREGGAAAHPARDGGALIGGGGLIFGLFALLGGRPSRQRLRTNQAQAEPQRRRVERKQDRPASQSDTKSAPSANQTQGAQRCSGAVVQS